MTYISREQEHDELSESSEDQPNHTTEATPGIPGSMLRCVEHIHRIYVCNTIERGDTGTLSMYIKVNLARMCGGLGLSHAHNGCQQHTHACLVRTSPSMHGCVTAASETCCQSL